MERWVYKGEVDFLLGGKLHVHCNLINKKTTIMIDTCAHIKA